MMSGLKLLMVLVGAIGALGLARARAGEPARGFLNRVSKPGTEDESKYVLFVPHSYNSERPTPLILFLHGSGETGTDGKRPAEVGLGPAIHSREKTFPFLVIFPQARRFSWQADSKSARRALEMVEEVRHEYKVDEQRTYLTGLSMGGYGVWSLAVADPARWAAIVPVCGGGTPKQMAKIKELPCWCFHGAQDKAVPVIRSRELIDALKEAGAAPRYTEYQDVGHNCWDKAYNTDELYDWLLQQRRR